MKKLALFAVVVLFAGSTFAQMLAAGTSELKVSGVLDFETADDTLLALDVFYGLFFADYTEYGVNLMVEESDHVSIWALGVEGEYNYDLGTELVPFVGAGIGYARYDVEYGGDEGNDEDNAIIVKGSAGAKYFITENVALSGSFVLRWASEDIFATQDDFEDTDAYLQLGMRFFF
jgi:hypothetical protein